VKIHGHFSQVQQDIAIAAKKCKLYKTVGTTLRKASVMVQRNNMMTVVVVVVVAAAKIR
jgi:hypothetical protein